MLEWARKYPHLKFSAVLSDAGAADDTRERGFVHEAVLARHPDLTLFDIYAAGPPAMVEAIRARFPPAGARAEALYFDSFDYAPKRSALRR